MKLLISESQLEVLIDHINEGGPKQVIEEGWKEVVLGTAMLMGIGLTGANAQTANNALEDSEILKKIELTLSGPNIEKVANTLEKGGLDNAMEKIEDNADQIKAKFDYAAKKKGVTSNITIYTTKSKSSVKGKVRQGYAISDIEVTQDTVWTPKDKIELDNTVEIVLDANHFNPGTFELSDSVKAEIKSTVDGVGVDGGISIALKPEQGPQLDWETMGNQEKVVSREKTAKYRYVKIKINSVVKPQPQKEEKAFDVIERTEYVLVRVNNVSTRTVKITGGSHFRKTTKKFKLKKTKVNGKSKKCFFKN